MSVLIKGMKIPKSEEKCKFFQPAPFRDPYCAINGVCCGLEDCPLVPVPPHGDLIDRDALPTSRVEWEDIVNAPTIIPAEEGNG